MRFPASYIAAAFVVPPPATEIGNLATHHEVAALTAWTSNSFASPSVLSVGVAQWIAATPTQADVQLLRQAFAEFYGVERDLSKSEALLSQAIDLWQSQPPDELAGLYRVRGDCYTQLADADKACSDYSKAIDLLKGPGGDKADPTELPAALLGRARALKSKGIDLSKSQSTQAAQDYRETLILSSREEWDTEQEMLEDGATRNPYAAWEWGAMLRQAGSWKDASVAHTVASAAFDDIGDRSRSTISLIDAGIDLATAGQTEQAINLLTKAIPKTKGVESKDVALLQRVIAKEGEGRMALAAIQWDSGSRQDAESSLGMACERLEQMQVDAVQRRAPMGDQPKRLRFSIDDVSPAVGTSCSRFKNSVFLDQLGWSETLQKKMIKLQTLR